MTARAAVVATDSPALPLSYVIALDALETWLEGSAPLDHIIYAHGVDTPRREPSFVRARALGQAGIVSLSQAREQGVTSWIATRCADPQPKPAYDGNPSAPNHSGRAMLRVLAALAAAASARRACPTDAELAKSCGLRDAEAARWCRRKLVAGNLIRVEHRGPTAPKIVTIVATGRRTAERG